MPKAFVFRPEQKIVGIQNYLSEYANSSDLAVAISIELDDFQFTTSINGSEIFPAASLLKIALSMSLEDKAKASTLNLFDRHTLEEIYSLSHSNSVLRGLVHSKHLTTEELLRIMLISSDELATYKLLQLTNISSINEFLINNKFLKTQLHQSSNGVSISGQTTALESLSLLKLARDKTSFSLTSASLENTILNSRIPLGVRDPSIKISHKTGSLPGVANDVAMLETQKGLIQISFLSKNQVDTVITGYKMGLCTAEILALLGAAVSRSLSVVSDNNG